MNRVNGGKGAHYDVKPKLNIKKVAATVIALLAVIMVIISIKNAFTKKVTTKNISVPTTYFSVYLNNKWGVIDNEGKEIIKPQYDEMIIIPDKNKDVFICTYDVNYTDGTYNTKVLNSTGNQVFQNYNNIEAIENNTKNKVWYETNILKFETNGKYGLIDFSGKAVLPPEYDNIYSIQGIEKSIIIEKDGKKGLVNSLGEIIIDPKYDEVSNLTDDYSNGYIVKNQKCGVITPDKKIALEEKYDSIEHVYGNNTYSVVEEGKAKVINNLGTTILESGFDKVKSIDGDYLTIEKAGKYGVIDCIGTNLIPAEYEDLEYCFEKNYIAKKDGKYGIIGIDNSTKIDFKYVSMNLVKNANFIEADNELYSTEIIDKNLNVVLRDVIITELNQEKGYFRVRMNNAYKYYNFHLEEKKAQDVLPTRTLFLVKENGKYGYENNKGEKVVDCKYDDAMEQNEYGYCAVKLNGKWGVLKSNGAVLMEPSLNLDEYLYIDFIGTWHMYKDISLNVYTK